MSLYMIAIYMYLFCQGLSFFFSVGHAHKVSELNVLHTVACRAHLLVHLVATTNAVEHGNKVRGCREGGREERRRRGREGGEREEGREEERDWYPHLWWSRALKRPL